MNNVDFKAMKQQTPTMEIGDIAFFKSCAQSSRPNQGQFNFKGHGFGIFLGALPPLIKDPTETDILALMGAIGFVSFDDVATFLGEDQMNALIEKIQERHVALVEKAKAAAEQAKEKETEDILSEKGIVI